jgi:hypothetical protein
MRIQYIDALRGIAAMAVVLHHYNASIEWRLLSYGNLGVPVFFVLSGFVIALSVGSAAISTSYIGRFALRRSVRLDPPYWLTMALVILVGYGLRDHVKFEGVTSGQVVAHMFYLQEFLGQQPILPVFWTLCYEVQFYLALLLILWATQAAKFPPTLAVLVLLLLSLADRHLELTESAFMGRFWFCFALGVLAHWTFAGRADGGYFLAALIAVGTFGAVRADGYAIASVLTAGSIALALRTGRPDMLSGPVWQFFGRISYSLYLTHLLFGWLAFRVAERIVPGVGAVLFGTAVAVASAWIFYVVAERPSVKLSHRIRVPRG